MLQAYWEAHPVERWTSRLTLGESTDYRTDLLNGAFNNSSNTRSRQLIWDNRLQAAPAHEFAVGLEALRQELQNSGLLPQRRERNADVARLGYLGRLGAHSLQVNLRTEDYSDFGRANTHFLGYGYDVTQAWRLTASTSTAFRAPTFIDLFGFGGNAALRPERARTRELGVQWADGPNLVRVVAFDTRYQDAITFDVQTFTVRNVRKASVHGVESSYSGQLAGIRRAKRYGSLAAYRSLGRLRLGGELIASGARPDTNIVSGARLSDAGYSVVNLTARYEIDKRLFVAARLQNAFDEKYQLVNGFNTPRRGVFLTAGWQP
jgi:vitamin B12 transporter